MSTLTGIKMKMSSSYHPESDGSSERSNRMVIQALRFLVERNQTGWVRVLPKVRFDIMNSVNASTGVSMFLLKTGRCPRVLPPLHQVPRPSAAQINAAQVISEIKSIENAAKDALLAAKVSQAFHADKNRGDPPKFKVGDKVLLTTVHRRNRAKHDNGSLVGKFYARYDGPYTILKAHPDADAYTLDMPTSANPMLSYYIGDLSPYVENDDVLFPGRRLPRLGPVTVDGVEEFKLDSVVDARRRGCGWQFLVTWRGWGLEDQRWLSYSALKECRILEDWVKAGGDGPKELLHSVKGNAELPRAVCQETTRGNPAPRDPDRILHISKAGGDGPKELLDSVKGNADAAGVVASLFGLAGTSRVPHVYNMNDRRNLGGLGLFFH